MGYFQPTVIYKNPNEERKDSIIRYIGNRVLVSNKKQNFLCGITGGVGKGKSYCGLALCEKYANMFNVDFNPEVHVISSLKELLKLITAKDRDKKIKLGSTLLFDEPQVEANSRTWQSEINVAFSTLISTFRNQQLVVFFALPYLEMIDKQSRIIFQGEFRVEGFDMSTKMTTVKPRFLEWNSRKGDFYVKRLKIKYKSPDKEVFTTTKLHSWQVELASKKILDVYEAKKQKFTNELNLKLLEKIELKEKLEAGRDKNEELFKIKELYEKYGEDYLKISKEMPHLPPYTIEKYLYFVKKSLKRVKPPRI